MESNLGTWAPAKQKSLVPVVGRTHNAFRMGILRYRQQCVCILCKVIQMQFSTHSRELDWIRPRCTMQH